MASPHQVTPVTGHGAVVRLDEAAAARLDRLYRLHADRVRRVARARTYDRDAAEDVASETWLRAAVSLPTLRADDEHAGGWLSTIAWRAACTHNRPRRAVERPRDWADTVAALLLPVTDAAEDVAVHRLAAVEQLTTGRWSP